MPNARSNELRDYHKGLTEGIGMADAKTRAKRRRGHA